MRIGLAQTNPIVGAFDYNLEKAKRFIEEAKRMGCDLVIFPEFSLIGYPPKDRSALFGNRKTRAKCTPGIKVDRLED